MHVFVFGGLMIGVYLGLSYIGDIFLHALAYSDYKTWREAMRSKWL